MTAETRGLMELLAVGAGLLALGWAPVWSRRHWLRRWHVAVPSVILAATVPLALPLVHDLRTHGGGDAAAWGRMGEFIILLGLVPLMIVAAGALAAGVFALGLHGWGQGPAPARRTREPWYAVLFRPRTRAETLMRLYVSLGSMVLVGVLWLLGLRPGV